MGEELDPKHRACIGQTMGGCLVSKAAFILHDSLSCQFTEEGGRKETWWRFPWAPKHKQGEPKSQQSNGEVWQYGTCQSLSLSRSAPANIKAIVHLFEVGLQTRMEEPKRVTDELPQGQLYRINIFQLTKILLTEKITNQE